MKRLGWLSGNDLDCRIEFPKTSTGAHQRPASADSGDKMSNAALGLLPDFGRSSIAVGVPIRGIIVLVRLEVPFGIGFVYSPRFPYGPVGKLPWVSVYHFGTIGCKNGLTLAADIGGHG